VIPLIGVAGQGRCLFITDSRGDCWNLGRGRTLLVQSYERW